MPHALVRSQPVKQGRIVYGLIVQFDIGDAEVMERRKHIVFERILERDLKCDDVIEQLKHVVTIGSIRSRRHTEIKLRLKEAHDLLIAGSTRAMSLVDNDVVKVIWRKLVEMRATLEHIAKRQLVLARFMPGR